MCVCVCVCHCSFIPITENFQFFLQLDYPLIKHLTNSHFVISSVILYTHQLVDVIIPNMARLQLGNSPEEDGTSICLRAYYVNKVCVVCN